MKAMVLTAGLGTRLRPLTLERAKPAIPFLGKPLIVWLLEKLTENGCREFRLNLHHLPHSIEKVFERSPWDALPVSFSYEREILGTAGGLKANEPFLDQGTFVMVNGDISIDFPLAEAVAFHRSREALATLVLFPQTPPYVHTPIRLDQEGRLVDFKGLGSQGKALPETYVFTGIHILEPDIFQYIPRGVFHEINDQAYPLAMKDGRHVLGFPVHGYWNDLGDPSRYLAAQRHWLRRRGLSPPVYVSPDAQAAESASVGHFVSAEAGCRLEAQTMIENSILWEDVLVKTGSAVRTCIVGSGMTIHGECGNRIITRHGEAPLV